MEQDNQAVEMIIILRRKGIDNRAVYNLDGDEDALIFLQGVKSLACPQSPWEKVYGK